MIERRTVQVSVEVVEEKNWINVKWENRILEDGEIIAPATYTRKCYGYGQRAEFLAEVVNASAYVNLIDWNTPPSE